MAKAHILFFAIVTLVFLVGGALAEQGTFDYPCHLVDAYNPDDDCWHGMDAQGRWKPRVAVAPELWLVGPPPSAVSGVTFPTDHWVELQFRASLIDGPGEDIVLIEQGQCGEQALVFLTDGAGQEYLLTMVRSLNTGLDLSTRIALDIAGISLPFEPCAIRIVAVDKQGGSPGFDIAHVTARIDADGDETAHAPVPPSGAKNVPPDMVLSWSPGRYAAKHVVYFGTTLDDVSSGAAPVNNPPQPQAAGTFDPGWLQLGRTYYWRIDEVNDVEPNSPWVGGVWSFTVTDHLVLDDFEFYNEQDNWMYKVWRGTPQAVVDISIDPVCQCSQAMKFYYHYASDVYAEAGRTFNPPQDWAAAGIKSLELSFYGRPDNYGDPEMYLAISDGSTSIRVPYDGDVNDIRRQACQLWRVNLQQITEVDFAHIETVSMGLRCGAAGPPCLGDGTVYFDNITLHPSRCLPENRPDADLNYDCAVDFQDVDLMAQNWLASGCRVYPVAAPRPPLAWYKFDGDTRDSVGSSHGVPHGSPTYVPGVFGQAIRFDGFDDSVAIDGAFELFSKINKKITIAFWLYGEDSPHHTDTLCCSNYTYGVRNPTIAINLGCWRQPGKYNWDCGYPWSFDSRLSGFHKHKREWTARWNHWAFTKDTTTGTMQIFLNGALYDSRTGSYSPISGISSFEIGSGWYGKYDGLLDDFRIYDYALSQPEIAYIATNGTGIFDLPLLSPADLHADDRIDFQDFALLATDWLADEPWL